MHDERWEPGMPVLDRQATVASGAQPIAPGPARGSAPGSGPELGRGTVPSPLNLPPSLRGLPARSVPETAPTPLQQHYVLLSVVVFFCGLIAITALEVGVPLGSPLVKLCAILGAPILVVTTADATLRIWRSAWAWMPVNRGRGLFRLAWVVAALVGLGALVGASVLIITA